MVSVRTTRQKRVQSITTIAAITECRPVPRMATSRIESSTGGNAIQISTSREISASTQPREKAGEQTEQRADQAGKPGGDEGDRERNPRAEDDAREHVAAEPVGAEQKARLGIGKADRRQRRRRADFAPADPAARSAARTTARTISNRIKPPAHDDLGIAQQAGAQSTAAAAPPAAVDVIAVGDQCSTSPPAQACRRRGLSAATVRSTPILIRMKINPNSSTRPWISGKSRLMTASMARLPMPG